MTTSMSSLNSGYIALVIGASGGIGSAFAATLENDPRCAKLIRLSRRDNGFDLCDESSIAQAAEKLAAEGITFDLILCATGALTIDGIGPEKTIRSICGEAMLDQFVLNAVGPALVLRYFTPLLARERRSVTGFLSARVGSIGDNRLGGWISYRASKAALNQIVHTAAIEIARSLPEAVVACLHPGTVATSLSERYGAGATRLSPEDSARRMLSVLDHLAPQQSGGFYAYDGSAIEW